MLSVVVKAFRSPDTLLSSTPVRLPAKSVPLVPKEAFDEQMPSQSGNVIYSCRAALPHRPSPKSGTFLNLALEAAKVSAHGDAITLSLGHDILAYRRVVEPDFCSKLFSKAAAKATLGFVEPADIAPLAFLRTAPRTAWLTGQTVSVIGGILVA